MKIETFMLADYATSTGGKLYVSGGGITRLQVPTFPAAIPSLAFLVRFRFADAADAAIPREATLSIGGPDPDDLQTFGPVDVQFEPGYEALLDGEDIWANLILMFGPFQMDRPGLRTLSIETNDGERATINLPIVAGSGPRFSQVNPS